MTGETRPAAARKVPGGRQDPEASGLLLPGGAFWCLLECFSPLFGPSFVMVKSYHHMGSFSGLLSGFPVKSLKTYKSPKLMEICQ
jgi:hypothetical protein